MKKKKQVCTSFVDISKVSKLELEALFSVAELNFSDQLSTKKRADWLAGRAAAKKALGELLAIEDGTEVALKEIEIVSHKFKKPSFILKEINMKNFLEIDLAISHTQGVGMAAATVVKKNGHVGVDLEKKRNFSEEFKKSFLTKSELDLLAQIKPEKADQIATTLWCVKEAYLKAKGVGLLQHPQALEIELFDDQKTGTIKEVASSRQIGFSCKLLEQKFIAVTVNIE